MNTKHFASEAITADTPVVVVNIDWLLGRPTHAATLAEFLRSSSLLVFSTSRSFEECCTFLVALSGLVADENAWLDFIWHDSQRRVLTWRSFGDRAGDSRAIAVHGFGPRFWDPSEEPQLISPTWGIALSIAMNIDVHVNTIGTVRTLLPRLLEQSQASAALLVTNDCHGINIEFIEGASKG